MFCKGKYGFAVPLLQDLVTIEKGTDNAQECLYMLAMAEYGLKDYQAASETFKVLSDLPTWAVCRDGFVLYRTEFV